MDATAILELAADAAALVIKLLSQAKAAGATPEQMQASIGALATSFAANDAADDAAAKAAESTKFGAG